MDITTIQAIIERINEFEETEDESLVLYATKINGEFRSNSEFVLLKLTEDERDMKTDEITKMKCPGFEYFLEIFLIKEILPDAPQNFSLDEKIEMIVHYAESDC